MDKTLIISRTADHVRKIFEGEGSGHDWWHIYRVWKLAERIGKEEGADLFVVELAALLHDIADYKFHGGDTEIGPKTARAWLEGLGAPEAAISHVCDIIRNVSFKGNVEKNKIFTAEGKAVQDADRLDAIGAIGIARAFTYGGHKGRPMHDPNEQPVEKHTVESYNARAGATVNHFHEKLLLLKDLMNTESGKRIAESRHAYMEGFLAEFHREWEAADY